MNLISSLELNATAKVLLYVLQERKADSAEGLTVTMERLGEYTGLHRNSVSKGMKLLHDMGYIRLDLGRGKASSTIKLTL